MRVESHLVGKVIYAFAFGLGSRVAICGESQFDREGPTTLVCDSQASPMYLLYFVCSERDNKFRIPPGMEGPTTLVCDGQGSPLCICFGVVL